MQVPFVLLSAALLTAGCSDKGPTTSTPITTSGQDTDSPQGSGDTSADTGPAVDTSPQDTGSSEETGQDTEEPPQDNMCDGRALVDVAIYSDSFACAIDAEGDVCCWGDPDSEDFERILEELPRGTFSSIQVGSYGACAIGTGSGLVCWGRKFNLDSPTNFLAISEVGYSFCAVRSSGSLYCPFSGWELDDVVAVTAGVNYACAATSSGAVSCNVTTSSSYIDSLKQDVPTSGDFVSIKGGDNHACALGADGTLTCWGGTDYKDHSTVYWESGQADAPAGLFKDVGTGDYHSCALKQDSGEIQCWGDEFDGPSSAVTSPPPGSYEVLSVSVRTNCVIDSAGALTCWSLDSDDWLVEHLPEPPAP
jgi:hypothetical protein